MCQFYRTRDDLIDTLVPFFVTGLQRNERCLWITSTPLGAADACDAMRAAIPGFDERVRRRQIEILDHSDWYTRTGVLGTDEVIAGWLEREAEALRDGYDGLRLSGNTFWLERHAWREFVEYEARVHGAFRDRRILALCSYSLAACTPDDLIDVLRNHKFALARRDGAWDLVHSVSAILAANIDATAAPEHTVEFYLGEDEFPAERVGRFLGEALASGDAAAILATPRHTAAILAAIPSEEVHALRTGRIALIDAEALFAAIKSCSDPSDVLSARVGAPILDLVRRHRRVRAFGELVDLFSRDRDREAALAIERWWNRFLDGLPIELLCSYDLASFDEASAAPGFRRLCAEHGTVIPVAGGVRPDPRLVAELQQVSIALEHEAARRRILESAEREAAEHLSRLQRVTSALSEAATKDDIAGVVAEHVAAVLGADQAVLHVPNEDGAELCLMSHKGLDPDEVRELSSVPVRAPWPVTVAFATGRSVWLPSMKAIAREYHGLEPRTARAIACIPLCAGGRRVGVVGFGFSTAREMAAPFRGFAEDLARQVALALDRSSLYEATKELYERARRERERAEAASRAKDEFLAMLGHELRNPLAPILTAVQLMRLRGGDLLARERTIIERQIHHMVRLVDDLLDISRITRGKVELKRAPVELAKIVASAIETVSPLLEDREHKLSVSVPAMGLLVSADANRLAQVVANLLSNAAKYTPRGGRVEVSAHNGGDSVSLTVRDNGIGIDPRLLPQMFDLFVQGNQGSDRPQGGLGLGLSIARTLVTMHGGTIRADSEGEGRGSAFTIELPAMPATASSSPATVSGAPVDLGATRGAGWRILVVDDNRDAAETLCELLTTIGYDVRTAYDGPGALEVAERFRPALALVDIGLPAMDGYELARRLVTLLADAPPKLVAITGYGQPSDRQRSRDAGFDDHFVKPVGLDRIREAIERLIPPRSGRSSRAAR